jgi:hypothetical protein
VIHLRLTMAVLAAIVVVGGLLVAWLLNVGSPV